MSGIFRRMAAVTTSAPAQRYTCCGRERSLACAAGPRSRGPYHGFLITHGESISIADYLTARDGDTVRHRPTCHYAYHPCDDAVLSLHEFAGKNFRLQHRKRLMMEEITAGIDELGVLLMGQAKGVYWYGSRLSIAEARRVAPHNNATSLQVTAAVLGESSGRSSGRGRGSSSPRRWISRASSKSRGRISAMSSAFMAIGPRSTAASGCFRKISTVMIRGSSRTSELSDAHGASRSMWLTALLLYALAASGDFAYHLIEDLHTGNQTIEFSEILVAFSAAVFWPVDLIAMALLATR